jgi:hypothetical protein
VTTLRRTHDLTQPVAFVVAARKKREGTAVHRHSAGRSRSRQKLQGAGYLAVREWRR